MSFFKNFFGKDDEKLKPRGLIRFVFLVVSHPDWQPTAQQMSAFIIEKLPEFERQPNGTAKIGLFCETKPMNSIDIYALATEAFGKKVTDESMYTYRTMHFGLKGGEAKSLLYTILLPQKINSLNVNSKLKSKS